jgi:hypothetical protein
MKRFCRLLGRWLMKLGAPENEMKKYHVTPRDRAACTRRKVLRRLAHELRN